MTSMENDLRFMEQTEKLVAEMLKTALAPENHNGIGGQNGLKIEETVEYVIIDETETKSKNTSSYTKSKDPTNRNELDKYAIELDNQPENRNMDYTNISDLESLISDGLHKIRLEYPMYAADANTNVYNCHDASVPFTAVSPVTESTFGNMAYNSWSSDPIDARTDASCSPLYNEEMNRLYNEEYWNNTKYDSRNVSVEWPQSNDPLLNVDNNGTVTSNDSNEESETISDEEDNYDNDEVDDEAKVSNTLPEETTVHCIMTQHDRRQILCNKALPDSLMQAELSHLNVNSNLNGVTTATGGASTTHLQICAGTPTAIHAAQSTTTTTTTSAGFGVLHQQTSCTTTNFVPNNLANAVLGTSPAALYAQSILTSTAHQYLNVFRKEIQQLLANSNNNNFCNATAPSWNLRIYERFLYAQLLQQQILQQQQQHAAIATLLQQQKIALQNNAAAAVASTYSNANVVATSSNTTSTTANDVSANDGGYTLTSLKPSVSNNINKSTKKVKCDVMVDLAEKNSFHASMSEVTEYCLGSVEKATLE